MPASAEAHVVLLGVLAQEAHPALEARLAAAARRPSRPVDVGRRTGLVGRHLPVGRSARPSRPRAHRASGTSPAVISTSSSWSTEPAAAITISRGR